MINRKIDIETNKKNIKKDKDNKKDEIWKLREGSVVLLTNVAVIFLFSICRLLTI